MARNKYPEVTVSKILDVALKLFLEKGYEQTTIQDIVDELGGLTKGAIYHHFKSKEDIITALGKNIFNNNNPFEKVRNHQTMNGLEKLRTVLKLSVTDTEKHMVDTATIPLVKNPRFLANLLDNQINIVAPLLKELFDEGIQDGSIKAKYSKSLSEMFVLLTNFWLTPSIFPATQEEILEKINIVRIVFDGIGIPVFDDELLSLCKTAAVDFIK